MSTTIPSTLVATRTIASAPSDEDASPARTHLIRRRAFLDMLACPMERASLVSRCGPDGDLILPRGLRLSTTTSVSTMTSPVDFAKVHAYVVSELDAGRRIRLECSYAGAGVGADTGADTGVDTETWTTEVLSARVGGFAGQCTVVVRVPSARAGTVHRDVNIKIFHNGSLQCTGVDHPESGVRAVLAVPLLCRAAAALGSGAPGTGSGAPPSSLPRVVGYRTVNTNSAYRLGFEVDREALHTLLSERYGLLVLYDPTLYPAVNAKFFFNTSNARHDGRCMCYSGRDDDDGDGLDTGTGTGTEERRRRRRLGRPRTTTRPVAGVEQRVCIHRGGSGDGPENCRRVTVSIFRSGSTLFTGARNCEQIYRVFSFIMDVCRRHRDLIEVRHAAIAPTVDGGESDPLTALLAADAATNTATATAMGR